jgi:SAM-dependent methyltransferase
MSNEKKNEKSNESFLAEYSSEAAVRKYSKKTAGDGISYLLDHVYGEIYLDAIRRYVSASMTGGIRMLEFGCGAGMNLIHCLGMLDREGISVETAYGTDFSERLINEASSEAACLRPALIDRVKFLVAKNESLVGDMAAGLNVPEGDLLGSFHLIIGVNTFRYPYRLGKGDECAKGIYDMLKPGGVCVMIDMNDKFPLFRTRVRDRLTRPENERYLPTLDEYAGPFKTAGLQVVEKRNFCWIPHSAGPATLATFRVITPVLNTLVPSFAMRSLVVSKKPA